MFFKKIKKSNFFLGLTIPGFLVLHFFGWHNFYYNTVNGYDKIVHFLAGACVTLALYWFIDFLVGIKIFKAEFLEKNKVVICLIGLIVVGLFWETFEFSVDHFVGRIDLIATQPSHLDTFSDILANFASGILVLMILFFNKKNSK